jgi:DeoR family myo-inositol catabolism operon transcriptional repressor
LRIQRIIAIENYLSEKKASSLKELCKRFDVSINTIRRDIDMLQKRGIVSKVYGGIVLNDSTPVIPYNRRRIENLDEKEYICRLAYKLIEPGSTIYIDSGTTPSSLVKHIGSDLNVTIVSNSLNVFNEALKNPGLNVIALGGLLNEKTNSFIGASTIKHLSEYRINKAFITATAMNIESGATNNSFHESEVKRAAIGQSIDVIMMIDHTKLSKQASISFCPPEKIHTLITDTCPDDMFKSYLNQNEIRLIY